jgi:hypothetical protein
MSSPLSDYFQGVGVKRLTAVEVAPNASNQHEFNGINEFRTILGTEKKKFSAKFIYLPDDEEKVLEDDGFMTWYDARENHASRTEYRLYYSGNDVLSAGVPGDLLVVGKTGGEDLAVIIAPESSTSEKQLLWLFGMAEAESKFVVRDFSDDKKDIGFAGRYILSSLGMEVAETAPDYLEELLKRFGQRFPTTKEFSDYARSTVKDISAVEEPDKTLMAWLEREELLFKTLEKVIVKEQLKKGFGKDGTDVEEFIKLSLSIQNRRKARAGFSFENNLAVLFSLNKIHYSHGAVTERNNKPDFVFPGISYYHDPKFNTGLLTMLGLKTTAKDRWRQVLSEAARLPEKHLITLEPAISRNQTEEMKANHLQLIIPEPLFGTYTSEQQKSILTLRGFLEMIKGRQGQYSETPLLF